MGRKLFQIVGEDVVEANVNDIVLDDDLSTDDIAKDEAAIEEISNTLDTTIQTQSDLVQQDIANNNVELPKEEDTNNSELAIESAVEKLGISREEFGIHAKSCKSFSVSKEGVKEVIASITKSIKELIKKIVRFFKELWTKLRMKLGNYREKVDNLVKALKSISEKNKGDQPVLTDKVFLDNMYGGLAALKLANTRLFVQDKKGSPLQINLNTVVLSGELTKWISTIADGIIGGKKKGGWFSKNTDWASTLKSVLKDAKLNRSVQFCNRDSYTLDRDKSNFIIGGSGDTLHLVTLEYSPKEHPSYPLISVWPINRSLTDIEGKCKDALTQYVKDTIQEIFKGKAPTVNDYQPVVDSFIENANEIKRAIDEAPKIFSNIENLQKSLEGIAVKLEKSSTETEDSDTGNACIHVAKYVKTVSSNLAGSIVKVYFSTIRDYLVIGNVIVKNATSNVVTKE